MIRSRTLVGRAVLATVAVALAGAPAAAQQLPPARQILDRYVEAVGGKAVWANRQSQRTVAEMSMSGVTIQMEMLAARPNKMLMKMNMPGMGEMLQGYDGQVAWSRNPMQGTRILAGAELAQTARQADFDSSVDPAKNFPTIETLERTEMAGQPCYMVRMVAVDGDEVRSCFHTETGLLLGSRTTSQSPMGPVEATTLFSDYRDFGGVKMPAKTVTSMAGQEMVVTVKEVTPNVVDPSVFELPADVKALVSAQQ